MIPRYYLLLDKFKSFIMSHVGLPNNLKEKIDLLISVLKLKIYFQTYPMVYPSISKSQMIIKKKDNP